MSKVRINDLARELEVKSRPILDALEAIGVTGKTHSSSIEADQAEKVREYFRNGGKSSASAKPPAETKPKFDLSKVSKPGDALKAILERKQAEAAAKAAPPRPAAVVVTPPVAAAPKPAAACSTSRRAFPGTSTQPLPWPSLAASHRDAAAPAAGAHRSPGCSGHRNQAAGRPGHRPPARHSRPSGSASRRRSPACCS